MDQKKLWKTAFIKFEGVWSAYSKPYPFKFFKSCLPQILLGPFSNTLSQMSRAIIDVNFALFSFLRIYSDLLKKSLMENFIFCAVCSLYLNTPQFPVSLTLLKSN